MSRRLMGEGLKALREATQDRIPLGYLTPNKFNRPLSSEPSHPISRQVPRDVYNEVMPDGTNFRPKPPANLPPALTIPQNKLPPRRAPEGFGNQFKRPSKNP